MPRGSSGGRSAPRARPATHAPLRNSPQAAVHAPPPAPLQGGNGSVRGGLGAAVADGLAIGTGSAVAHRAVDAVMGPRVIHHETVGSSAPAAAPAPAPTTSSLGGADACGGQFKALQDCLNNYGSDISNCQFYMDMLQECRRGSAGLGA
ncbi:Cox19-like CHCH family protein [Melia azedarach]|uniref:Cox19-like CHCH family protein n=1 Tax=Melia azedarach TaxID=155640 RepID=A0ACC1WQJ9_MELAZ|nr:Cox19-like CHCH family protein [Melia azedarach]